MRGNFARYFTANRLVSWPLWKTAVSGVLALAIAGSGAGAAVAAVSAASAASSAAPVSSAVATPAPTAVPVDASWLSLKWDAVEIADPQERATEAQITMQINVSQQKLGLDLYESNSVTGKKSAFNDADVTVTLTCVSLDEVQDAANKYENDASKEGAVTDYPIAKGTSSLLIDKLNPGKYTVSVACADKNYIMPAAQNVTVKEKVTYKKTDKKAATATTADLKEDQVDTNTGGETVTLASTKNTKAYVIPAKDASYTWAAADGSNYLYYRDGSKSPYKVELGTGNDSGGQTVSYIKKATYDAAMAASLAPAGSTTASGSSVKPAMVLPGVFAARIGAYRLLSAPVEETPTPSPTPTATETPAPSPTPTATETPAASPTPTATATAAASPTPTATATPTASPTASPSPVPTATPVAVFELYSDTNGGVVQNDAAAALLKLPAVATLILGGNTSAGGQVQGIDISYHQGSIDFNAVKAAGVNFVIIRVGYRGYGSGKVVLDPNFHTYMKAAKAAGLRVGVYFFSQAINAQEGVEEASAAINAVAAYGLDYPIFIDSEYSTSRRTGRADGLSQAARTEAVVAFCETVKNSGYRTGVYASSSWYRNQLNYATVSQYTVWNAHYGVASSPISCAMWQYTSKGQVSGISTNVDLNISYIG